MNNRLVALLGAALLCLLAHGTDIPVFAIKARGRSEYIVTDSKQRPLFEIDRATSHICPAAQGQGLLRRGAPTTIVSYTFGILGYVQMTSGPYLAIISEVSETIRIIGHACWRVTNVDLIPISPDSQPDAEEKAGIANVKGFLASGGFIFSHGYSLALSQQLFLSRSPIPRDAAHCFVANMAMRDALTQNSGKVPDALLNAVLVTAIRGFVSAICIKLRAQSAGDKEVRLYAALISRSSTVRAVTRYNFRGADGHGNVSNFVETELIVAAQGTVAAFAQVRGSVPVLWSQDTTSMSPRPPIVIPKVPIEAKAGILRSHVHSLATRYGGRVVAINLLEQAGFELELSSELVNTAAAATGLLPELDLVHFDLHQKIKQAQASGVGWEAPLIVELGHRLETIGFFSQGHVNRRQEGVFRINCLDCMDRTNMVQSALAKHFLPLLFKACITDPSRRSPPRKLLRWLQDAWADNADAISQQYAGTSALRTELTRNGRQSYIGTVKDAWTSVSRYINAKFLDEARQAGMDLCFRPALSLRSGSYDDFECFDRSDADQELPGGSCSCSPGEHGHARSEIASLKGVKTLEAAGGPRPVGSPQTTLAEYLVRAVALDMKRHVALAALATSRQGATGIVQWWCTGSSQGARHIPSPRLIPPPDLALHPSPPPEEDVASKEEGFSQYMHVRAVAL